MDIERVGGTYWHRDLKTGSPRWHSTPRWHTRGATGVWYLMMIPQRGQSRRRGGPWFRLTLVGEGDFAPRDKPMQRPRWFISMKDATAFVRQFDAEMESRYGGRQSPSTRRSMAGRRPISMEAAAGAPGLGRRV